LPVDAAALDAGSGLARVATCNCCRRGCHGTRGKARLCADADGSLEVRYRGKCLEWREIPAPPKNPPAAASAVPARYVHGGDILNEL